MTRLVFLTVNCSYSHSSLALPMLHSACRDIPGWEWIRKEITSEEDPAKVASEIAETHCDLLCATLYLFNRNHVMNILARVKALVPGMQIAVGGPECPACDADSILERYPFLSAVFSGEGEGEFPEYLRRFEENKNRRRNIPGGKNAVWEQWQTALPSVRDPFFRTDKPFVQIETSRGCPMACAYCTSSGVRQRYKALEDVRNELVLLHEKGIREIRVLDRTFNLPQSRGAALLRIFAEFPNIRFHLEVHPQFIGEELQECFRSARPGQLHIEAGIQSLNPIVQRAIGRKSDVAEVLSGLCFLTSCTAFETHTDLLAGLPEQTLESLEEDILTLIQQHPAEIQLEVLKILPGTPILHSCVQYGITFSPEPPYDVMRTSAMSTADILTARTLSRLLDLFYNHKALHPILVSASKGNQKFFLELAESILRKGMELNTLLNLKKRFLFLTEFLWSRNLSAEGLTMQWLKSGFPVGEGPAECVKPIRTIPTGAEWVEGEKESLTDRESRFYVMPCCTGQFYFIFNRKYCFNQPCAILYF